MADTYYTSMVNEPKKLVRVLIWHMILKVNIISNILTKFKDDNTATSKYTTKVIHKKNI